MSLTEKIHQRLLRDVARKPADDVAQLNSGLRLLSKWRSVLIQNTLLQHEGTAVMSGIFKGLDFLPRSAEGCHVAKLLGCYEQPLMPYIAQAIEAGYPLILNIGCAEGYYAVGMAMKMPATTVLAYDLNPDAQSVCAQLAEKNGVGARVGVGALFTAADFAAHAGDRVLVMCDIEGAERQLLDPVLAPALRGMDLIVESHDCLFAGTTRLLVERFAATHDITIIEDNGQRQLPAMPAWFNQLAHLDQLLAAWEWREGPTPWLVMRAKTGNKP